MNDMPEWSLAAMSEEVLAALIKGDAPKGKCGCGRDIRYMTTTDPFNPDKGACNKYRRCLSRNELEALLKERSYQNERLRELLDAVFEGEDGRLYIRHMDYDEWKKSVSELLGGDDG